MKGNDRLAASQVPDLNRIRTDTRKALANILTEQINERIADGLPKAITVIAMAPARVAIKADCTVKSYTETGKCGF